MTHNYKLLLIAAGASLLFSSCGQNGSKTTTTAIDTTKPYPAISMTRVENSTEYPSAQLSIKSVKAAPQGKDSAKVSFEFTLTDYELGIQTADTDSKICNNSAKGQHIHFIMDNQPYMALYAPKNEVVLANNTEHYLMAFLSRSYHESLKQKGAAVVYHFKIDEKGKLVKMDEPKTPMIFYSRPKGDYIGNDTANVLFDFYVWNTTLGDSSMVKASFANEGMKGHDTSFTVSKWEANFLHNLGQGKTKVTLTLVGKDGKEMEGPNTKISRTVNLFAQEPMKK